MEQDFNLSDGMVEWARREPRAPAIIDADAVTTYGELHCVMLHAMEAFRRAGLAPGALVAVSVQQGFALQLAVSLALLRAGLGQVWLRLEDPVEYRAARAAKLGVDAVITDVEQGALPGVLRVSPESRWLAGQEDSASLSDLRVPAAGRTMIIAQSSGTTGVPKDIAISQADERVYTERWHASLPPVPGERCMNLSGPYFWSGLTRAVRCLASGSVLVVPPPRWTGAELLELVDRQAVTAITCTPMHLKLLVDAATGSEPRWPRMRYVRCSAAALSVPMLQAARQRLTPNIFITYGSNEASVISAAPPALLDRYPDCVGIPSPGIELEIVDADHAPVSAGTPGHVRMRGAGISAGRTPGGARDTRNFRDGWYYPGDIGVLNGEGVLFLKGRSDEVMNFDGIMVGPDEIESVLARYPDVAEVAAFAVPSDLHQDIPAAALVVRRPVALEDLARYCAQHLGVRAPRRFFFLDALPRSPLGKVLRRKLTEIAVASDAKSAR